MLTSFKKQITASMIAASFAMSGSAFAAELEKSILLFQVVATVKLLLI